MNPYETLNVPKDASKEQVRRAYRKKAQRAHPDKGGNASEFHAIVRAYDILSDDARKAHYDKFGEDKEQLDSEAEKNHFLAQLFASTIDSVNDDSIDFVDLVALVQQQLQGSIFNLQSTQKKMQRAVLKWERAAKRMHCKNKRNVFDALVTQRLRDLHRNINTVTIGLKLQQEALADLAGYKYECSLDPRTQASGTTTFFFGKFPK